MAFVCVFSTDIGLYEMLIFWQCTSRRNDKADTSGLFLPRRKDRLVKVDSNFLLCPCPVAVL